MPTFPQTIVLAAVFLACAIPLPLSAKPSDEPLDVWLGGPWKEMHIGHWLDDGCTGGSIRNEATITREGSKIHLTFPAEGKGERVLSSFSRPMQFEELEKIKDELLAHQKVAESELDLNEHFARFPPEEQKAKLEEYFKSNGRP